ncbi:hypothetical protein PRIC1_001128 [Phytophthora ramorum]
MEKKESENADYGAWEESAATGRTVKKDCVKTNFVTEERVGETRKETVHLDDPARRAVIAWEDLEKEDLAASKTSEGVNCYENLPELREKMNNENTEFEEIMPADLMRNESEKERIKSSAEDATEVTRKGPREEGLMKPEGSGIETLDGAAEALGTLREDASIAITERLVAVAKEGKESMSDGEVRVDETVPKEQEPITVKVVPKYSRLFTTAELEALEKGRTSAEAVEKEEYEKELEEKLFPLDEIELKRRVKKNAEQQKEPSLDDISTLLSIPVETLARTKEASPGALSSPEYWLEWYKSTLATSEEAKRANRDFKTVNETYVAVVDPGRATSSDCRDVGGGSDVVADEVLRAGRSGRRRKSPPVTECDVALNILVDVAGLEPRSKTYPTEVDEYNPEKLPPPLRALVRIAVYELVREDERPVTPMCSSCRSKVLSHQHARSEPAKSKKKHCSLCWNESGKGTSVKPI